MSRLEELIAELCPDGVEYVKLSSICEIKRGERVTKSQLMADGKYPVFSGGVSPMGYYDSYNREKETITIAQYGTAGYVNWINEDFWANDVCYSLYPNEKINKRFLYFVLVNMQEFIYSLRIDAVPAHMPAERLESIKIPLPPIPIQQEIVRILDNLTDLTTELKEKLTSELIARRKQFEYYRDQIIHIHATNKGKTIALKDICAFVTVGIANSATHAYSDSGIVMFRNQNIKENYLDDSDIIYINEEFEEKYKTKRLKKDDILVTRTGYPGQACLVPEKYEGSQTFTTLIARLRNTDEVSPKYICYFINSNFGKAYVNSVKTGAAQQNFGSKALENMPIIIPPFEVQKKISEYLDHLNTVYSDMLSSLTAEIDARQKQYEYYRDKLLTFKEVKS